MKLKSGTHNHLKHRDILGMRVDATSYEDATQRILEWSQARESHYVCVANVHMNMEVYDNPAFADVVNSADLVTPDGMPLVWALTALGVKDACRVYGPTLTLHVCEAAAHAEIPIGLYGGTPESLHRFVRFLYRRFPHIQIACQITPPFRSLMPEEDERYTQEIINSGAKILFVGIGCPRQELWMGAHKNRIPGVMLGVGAAFDFHSGRIKQAPNWMQQVGMEWIFRLFMEPQRLWKRYLKHNPRFVVFFLMQWFVSLKG
jgi:N-acetylglucosaminyldiphosphoundecaprenol N-acetyl-beta-D-mannosaminyltransferase